VDGRHLGEVIRRRFPYFFFGGYQTISQDVTIRTMMKSVLQRVKTWPVAIYFSALLDSIRPRTFIICEDLIQSLPSRAGNFLRESQNIIQRIQELRHTARKAESMRQSKGDPQTFFLTAALRILKRALGGPGGTRGMQAKGSILNPSRRQR